MKIGILTYHRSNNYGALLQGIALREVLVRAGHQVSFIDYWPSYHRHMYALFSFSRMMSCKGIKGKFLYLRDSIKYCSYRKARKESFGKFITEDIEPFTSPIDETYDVIVHGSDQIWRKQEEINAYNPVYFGKHQIQAKKKISYAASMGVLPADETSKSTIKDYLSNLDYISVREKGLQKLAIDLGFSGVVHDLDPTLLLPMDFWVNRFNLRSSDERYALYYKIQNSFDINKIREYADSQGLNLKIIYHKASRADSSENIVTADPRRFLELIYGAEVVFTSSFHGLAFALLFHKPFFASFTKNAGRAMSLLDVTHLNDRYIQPQVPIPFDNKEIDYSMVDRVLSEQRALSIHNLYDSLSV